MGYFLLASCVYDAFDATTDSGCGRGLDTSQKGERCYARVFSSLASLFGAITIVVFVFLGAKRMKPSRGMSEDAAAQEVALTMSDSVELAVENPMRGGAEDASRLAGGGQQLALV